MKPETINDAVERIHEALIEDDEYRRLIEAVWNEDAVEGSLLNDDLMAAQKIRAYAEAAGVSIVAQAQLASVRRALGVVLRRYGLSRKQRRELINK